MHACPRPSNSPRAIHHPPSTHRTSVSSAENSYFQVENTQSDILDRVFLIIWINAFNSCENAALLCPPRPVSTHVVEKLANSYSAEQTVDKQWRESESTLDGPK